MILTAQLYDTFDRCHRRLAYERTHEPLTISPLGLLYAAVERSLMALDAIQGVKDAVANVTSRLEVNSGDLSPISSVRHVQAMGEVIALALREKLGQATIPAPVPLESHEWQPGLFDFKGSLHRIVLASHLDDDSLRSFAHAWQTIGELAAMERPIFLTIVVIGAQRGGRRHSHWTKAFQHPIQKSALRFAPRKKNDEFTANWKPIWREQSNISAETWLERMKSDEVIGDLIVSRKINYDGEDQRMIQAKKDMLEIAEQMETARTDAPMRRSSCDEIGRGACPFQACCYSPDGITPMDLPHLFRRKPLVEIKV